MQAKPLTQQDLDQDIQELQSQSYTTKRATVPSLEEILYVPHRVLDHGFIRVVDYMGDDDAIVQSARVSYGKGTKQVNQDQGLINYLMRHRHTTPFEMAEIKFHIKLPIFIARQWIRHRTANVNEYSARYSILDKEFYIPTPEQMALQSSSNRQGRDQTLSGEQSQKVLAILKEDAMRCYGHYEDMLNLQASENDTEVNPFGFNEGEGLARELARMNLPVNFYTQWYWKIDLHNLFHFLSLRADSHAQYEIRAYAEIMLDIVKKWVPYCYQAFQDYRLDAMFFSGKEKEALRQLLDSSKLDKVSHKLSPREWREFQEKITKVSEGA